jgi:HlyD family secretion protein
MTLKRSFFLLIAIPVVFLQGCNEKVDGDVYFQGYSYGEYTYLFANADGVISKIPVKKGDFVEKGATLIEMDDFQLKNNYLIAVQRLNQEESEFKSLTNGVKEQELEVVKSQLNQAILSEKLAFRNLERNKKLFSSKAISAIEIDHILTEYENKKEKVNELNKQLKAMMSPVQKDKLAVKKHQIESARLQTVKAKWEWSQSKLIAPISSQVTDIIYSEGESIRAGKPIISLLPENKIKVRFFVPEHLLGTIKTNMKVAFKCSGCGEELFGIIRYISPQAEYTPPVIYSNESKSKLVYMIEAEQEEKSNATIKVGQPINVRVLFNE